MRWLLLFLLIPSVGHAANACGTIEVGAVIAAYKQRARFSVVNAAVELAVTKE